MIDKIEKSSRNHKWMKGLFAFFLFFVIGSAMQAQTSCGTKISQERFSYEMNTISERSSTYPRLFKTLSISAYIVNSPANVPAVSLETVLLWVDSLNVVFAPLELSFEVCTVVNVPNHKFYNFDRALEEEELYDVYSTPGTINIYFLGSILDNVSEEEDVHADGYTYFPGGDDLMVLSDPKEIIHQMGHFFGLYDTHETDFGEEHVLRNNCETTGDLICDTDADPWTDFYEQPSTWNKTTCNLTEAVFDAQNQFYVPQMSNIMSFWDPCRCYFTNQQFDKMAFEYLNNRNYLR